MEKSCLGRTKTAVVDLVTEFCFSLIIVSVSFRSSLISKFSLRYPQGIAAITLKRPTGQTGMDLAVSPNKHTKYAIALLGTRILFENKNEIKKDKRWKKELLSTKDLITWRL